MALKKLGSKNYALITQGVKLSGTYDPEEIFFVFEKQLYVHEAEDMWNFLKWVHEDTMNRCFGSHSYEKRFKEFLSYQEFLSK